MDRDRTTITVVTHASRRLRPGDSQMDRRKRRALAPLFESMEDRVVLSVTSVSLQHLHHQKAAAVHVAKMSVATGSKANAKSNDAALRNLQQQLEVVHEHALERTPSAIPTAAEKQATEVSNVFKSLESAL
jgi:hypothetical protein